MAVQPTIVLYEKGTDADGNRAWSADTAEIIRLATAPLRHNAKTFCMNMVTEDYTKDALTDADAIVISYDTRGGKITSARGFAALELRPEKGEVYIDLICNAARPKVALRTDAVIPGGSAMLNQIKAFAVHKGYKYIKLKALEHVIPYYYRFGWRFISGCGAKENSARETQVRELHNILKTIKLKTDGMMDPTDAQAAALTSALAPFKPYQNDFYSVAGATAAAAAATNAAGRAAQDEREEMVKTSEQRAETTREAGYTMIWCVNDPKGTKAREWVPPRRGGSRKKKGRTRRKRKSRRRKTRRQRGKGQDVWEGRLRRQAVAAPANLPAAAPANLPVAAPVPVNRIHAARVAARLRALRRRHGEGRLIGNNNGGLQFEYKVDNELRVIPIQVGGKRRRKTRRKSRRKSRRPRRPRRRRRRPRRRTRKRSGAGWEKKVFGDKKYTKPSYKTYKTVTYPFRKPRKFLRQFPGQGTRIAEWRQKQREN